MSRMILTLILIIAVAQYVSTSLLVYEADLSEYCMRQVSMAVMLGRHTIFSSSTTLQLNRLDVPYTCYITVRTEAGSDIILTVHTNDMIEPCIKSADQLLVYNLEETFGGYRGPWAGAYTDPDMLKRQTKQYTLHPTTSTTTKEANEEVSITHSEPENVSTTEESKESIETSTDYRQKLHNSVDVFDNLYDVAPKPGVEYDTTIIPLVQFSLMKEENENIGVERRYQFDYRVNDALSVTPESSRRKYTTKRPFHELISVVVVTNGHITTQPKHILRRKKILKPKSRQRKYKRPTYHHDTQIFDSNEPLFSTNKLNDKNILNATTETTDSWHIMIQTIKNVNESDLGSSSETTSFHHDQYEPTSLLLQKLSNRNHINLSKDLNPALGLESSSSKSMRTFPSLYSKISLNRFTRTPLKFGNQRFLKRFQPFKIKDIANHNRNTSKSMTSLLPSPVSTSESRTQVETTRPSIKVGFKQTVINTTESTKNNKIQPMTNEVLSSLHNDGTRAKHQQNNSDLVKSMNFDNSENSSIIQALESATILHTASSPINEPNELSTLLNETKIIENVASSFHHSETSEKMISAPKEKGALVDRESWENVVQVAPEIAMILNHTSKYDIDTDTEANDTLVNIRRKRYVEAIPLKDSMPHQTSTHVGKTQKFVTVFNQYLGNVDVLDRDDLKKLVERQNGMSYGHINMYDWKNHVVGAMIYNICEHQDAFSKVFLFNSSRIVISINDFTISNLMIVLTTTKILSPKESMCPKSHVECQVNGARVCVESSCACDGIPNCGFYDSYDEDLLRCKVYDLLEHNLVLAACTFLVVLLTVLYSVHYWLKRCVPKVSQAFFVYTDSGDNILLLKSIMKSPTEPDNSSSMNPDKFYGDIYEPEMQKTTRNVFTRFWQKLLLFRFQSSPVTNTLDDEEELRKQRQKMYSFTELEIKKMLDQQVGHADAIVQTGSSLEMQPLDGIRLKGDDHMDDLQEPGHPMTDMGSNSNESVLTSIMNPLYNTEEHELKVLQLFKESRSDQSVDTLRTKSDTTLASKNVIYNESELREINYAAFQHNVETSSMKHDTGSMRPSCSYEIKQPRTPKRIRFENIEQSISETRKSRGQNVLETERQTDKDRVPDNNLGRRIWSNIKGNKKQVKKKAHVPNLQLNNK